MNQQMGHTFDKECEKISLVVDTNIHDDCERHDDDTKEESQREVEHADWQKHRSQFQQNNNVQELPVAGVQLQKLWSHQAHAESQDDQIENPGLSWNVQVVKVIVNGLVGCNIKRQNSNEMGDEKHFANAQNVDVSFGLFEDENFVFVFFLRWFVDIFGLAVSGIVEIKNLKKNNTATYYNFPASWKTCKIIWS